MAEFRILCGHRHGPTGALTWGGRVEDWLAAEIPGLLGRGAWYPGRPLLVTANDYSLNLFNGDTGVVVSSQSGRATAAFERGGTIEEVSPHRLASVESAHAMTIHKSQGSQFRTVAVILPGPDSPILTRELLYTAVTRARERVVLVAAESSVCRAVERPITRSSGLRELLWNR
jgi:exodeoxyribonuclease V alpha subunit